MAYRSSGADNDGMVSNLKRFGVISAWTVEQGFRKVDRKFFVPKGHLRMAHTDQPIKEDNIHISAPHIYGTVMEALELPENSPLSFLNVGSGTGYLTCIAASILGPKSSHYCIELHADAIEHCKQAIASWKNESLEAQKIHQINIIHGNALHLDVGVGECALGFDRIYIGASIEVAQLPMFKNLLKLGGILVGPVDGDLLKVVRLETPICNAGTEPQEYTEEVLSPVRFAPLVSYPRMGTVIPARVWTPSLHQFYPDSFQKSCKTILLCSRSNYVQPIEPRPKENVNIAAMLPPALWLEILSYTRRDWFEAPLSEVEDLRRRLRKEQEIAERASRASVEANARCHLAERERDLYKSMLLRLRRRMRIRSIVLDEDEDTEMDSLDDAATSMLLGGHGSLSMIGLAQLFRSARDQAINFAESDNENDSEDESHEAHNTNGMDEDEEMVDYDDDDESSASAIEDHHESDESSIVHGPLSDPSDLIVTRQVRTVSITGTDV